MSGYYRSHNKWRCKKRKIGKLLSEANAILNITIRGVCNFERALLVKNNDLFDGYKRTKHSPLFCSFDLLSDVQLFKFRI